MNAITASFLEHPDVQAQIQEFRLFKGEVMRSKALMNAEGQKEAAEIIGAAQVLIGQKNLVLLLSIANKIDAEHSPGIKWAKAIRKK